MSEQGALKVWHIPQVPGTPFEVNVRSVEEGYRVLEILAHYDIFQYEHRIKPDYSNASGLSIFEDGEWSDWYDPDSGMDLDEYAADKGWASPLAEKPQ